MLNRLNSVTVSLLIVVGLPRLMRAESKPAIRIDWDRSTLTLVQEGAVYGRMTRVTDALLCCFERDGACWVRRSVDEGKTWKDPVKAAAFAFGKAANPELLKCRDGLVILFYNQRPTDQTHPYAIAMSVSRDDGLTWTPTAKPLYEAGPGEGSGCYEPSAIQLVSGEIQLFFANEFPHQSDSTQEISLMRSTDNGLTWDKPRAVSYRAGHRDGMPVPIVLLNKKGIALAIEDDGVTSDREFKPTIIRSLFATSWGNGAVGAESQQRWPAVDGRWSERAYAGAPYLRQLPTGETILSCQSTLDRKVPQMTVYIGDSDAKHFANPTEPFSLSDQTRGVWNSLFVKNQDVVTAISSTKIDGVRGVWAVDGNVVR
jgi:hypothetical protein